jgi:hypothetical protein
VRAQNSPQEADKPTREKCNRFCALLYFLALVSLSLCLALRKQRWVLSEGKDEEIDRYDGRASRKKRALLLAG